MSPRFHTQSYQKQKSAYFSFLKSQLQQKLEFDFARGAFTEPFRCGIWIIILRLFVSDLSHKKCRRGHGDFKGVKQIAAPLIAVVLLAGCSQTPRSFFASDGPSPSAITEAAMPVTGEKIPVVDLFEAQAYMYPEPPSHSGMGPNGATSEGSLSGLRGKGRDVTRLREGDTVSVTIFDSGEEGLFASTESKRLDLGQFTVDSSGSVTLPFVGRQRVEGSTPAALQNQIVNGLRGSAVNPQAVVSVVDKPSAMITVDGEVASPGLFPVTTSTMKVLDVIAQAGGAKSSAAETTVTVERGGHRATASLETVLASRAQNIAVYPGDRVFLETAESQEASFSAFGAFKNVGTFTFETGDLTLAEAVGKAGGLQDDKADPLNLYLFRTQKLPVGGVSYVSKSTDAPASADRPIIVRVNLKDPANFIYMQNFAMKDHDLLYVGDATSVDLAKYFHFLKKPAMLPASSGGSS
ncbi:polysaccharide biosynthesis/export family protein [Fulvimarina sp. MAC8]|uniref:polysaccharide biosynthesis/export family protein n=1 Tax=Fulvimarina sp. MAC8 TaxID=3162874 RepID=UPI0032EAABE0